MTLFSPLTDTHRITESKPKDDCLRLAFSSVSVQLLGNPGGYSERAAGVPSSGIQLTVHSSVYIIQKKYRWCKVFTGEKERDWVIKQQ